MKCFIFLFLGMFFSLNIYAQSLDFDRKIISDICFKIVEQVNDEMSQVGIPVVAIFDFKDMEGKYGERNMFYFSEKCRENFVKSKKYKVVNRTMLHTLLEELNLQNTSVFDQETSLKIGKMTGAQWIFTGDIFLWMI